MLMTGATPIRLIAMLSAWVRASKAGNVKWLQCHLVSSLPCARANNELELTLTVK
jgi:hypothetical protein